MWLVEVAWGTATGGMPPRPPTPAPLPLPLPSPLCDAEWSEPEAVAGVPSGVGDDEGSLVLVWEGSAEGPPREGSTEGSLVLVWDGPPASCGAAGEGEESEG
ncbi:hypothetical protein CG747_12850 [Streptomyces sp. CB02959]|nr:hypothetical protein CG747_12850 [Streptomyces sp. CB02959]